MNESIQNLFTLFANMDQYSPLNVEDNDPEQHIPRHLSESQHEVNYESCWLMNMSIN